LTGLFSALAADAQETPKFEVGPVVSYVHVFLSPPIQAQNEFEIGGRFSWNVNRWLGLEVESQASPFRTENLFDAYQGGYLWQTFAGAKVGKRWDRFGLFGKFRPGISNQVKEFLFGFSGADSVFVRFNLSIIQTQSHTYSHETSLD
jgi:hypothetical protein